MHRRLGASGTARIGTPYCRGQLPGTISAVVVQVCKCASVLCFVVQMHTMGTLDVDEPKRARLNK